MTVDRDNLHPAVRRAVEAVESDPEAKAIGLRLFSGFRPPDHSWKRPTVGSFQSDLYADAEAVCRRNRAKCPASKWVAQPWFSNHGPRVELDGSRIPPGTKDYDGWGIAGDWEVVRWPDGHGGSRRIVADQRGQWPTEVSLYVQKIWARHGLRQVMDYEDWHAEPVPGFDYAQEDDVGLTDAQAKQLLSDVARIKADLETDAGPTWIDDWLKGISDTLGKKLDNIAKRLDAIDEQLNE